MGFLSGLFVDIQNVSRADHNFVRFAQHVDASLLQIKEKRTDFLFNTHLNAKNYQTIDAKRRYVTDVSYLHNVNAIEHFVRQLNDRASKIKLNTMLFVNAEKEKKNDQKRINYITTNRPIACIYILSEATTRRERKKNDAK